MVTNKARERERERERERTRRLDKVFDTVGEGQERVRELVEMA